MTNLDAELDLYFTPDQQPSLAQIDSKLSAIAHAIVDLGTRLKTIEHTLGLDV